MLYHYLSDTLLCIKIWGLEMKNLLVIFSVIFVCLTSIAHANCSSNGRAYPPGARLGPSVCMPNGTWQTLVQPPAQQPQRPQPQVQQPSVQQHQPSVQQPQVQQPQRPQPPVQQPQVQQPQRPQPQVQQP